MNSSIELGGWSFVCIMEAQIIISKLYCISYFSEDCCDLENNADPAAMCNASFCGISSGPTLFTKVPVYWYPVYKRLTLKAPITTAADDNFCDIFPSFRQKQGMKFHENHLPADDSHEMSCLICFCFLKKGQNLKLSSAANYRWRFMG